MQDFTTWCQHQRVVRQPIIWQRLWWKLHENLGIWTEAEARNPSAPWAHHCGCKFLCVLLIILFLSLSLSMQVVVGIRVRCRMREGHHSAHYLSVHTSDTTATTVTREAEPSPVRATYSGHLGLPAKVCISHSIHVFRIWQRRLTKFSWKEYQTLIVFILEKSW